MKTVTGYWFAPKDKKLANNDGRKIRVGITHKVNGDIVPCEHGLHLSKRPYDALFYAPGPVIYKVKGSGVIIPHGNPIDKYVCSERTYIAGGYDCTELLRQFSRKCALDVVYLWDAPDVVIQYLKTGDEKLRNAARVAAWDAARVAGGDTAAVLAAGVARDTAWDATWVAWDAAWVAWDAARVAGGDTTRDTAWVAAWVARDAYINKKANRRLVSMLSKHLRT